MLFDLQSAGRRRTIKVVYIALAILMFVGFVGFSVGSSVGGGIFDALSSNKGGGDQISDRAKSQVRSAEAAAKARPKDASAWAQLATARVRLAGVGDNVKTDSQGNVTYEPAGRAQLNAATTAWDRYLALNPKTDTESAARTARLMLNAFVTLDKPTEAVSAQEIVTESSQTYNSFAQLAVYAWAAGQTRKGDLASQKAVEIAPQAQRKTLKTELAQQKKSVTASAAGATGTATATATPSG